MKDQEFIQWLEEHYQPAKIRSSIPVQEPGPPLSELAELLEVPPAVLRARLEERGELVMVGDVPHMLRWQEVPLEVAQEMICGHREWQEALLGYRMALQQGFMSPDGAWKAVVQEFERRKVELAGLYRRWLGL